MAMDSLVKFSTEVIKTAENRREEQLSHIREKEMSRLEGAKADIQSKKLSKIRIECTKIKLNSDKEISILKNDLKKDIFKRREEMFEDIFAQVAKGALEYKNSPEYIKNTEDAITCAIKEMGGEDIVCFALGEDIIALKNNFPQVKFKEASADIIGGFSLMSEKQGLYLDMTLKSKIEEQKKQFYRKSGLVLNQ